MLYPPIHFVLPVWSYPVSASSVGSPATIWAPLLLLWALTPPLATALDGRSLPLLQIPCALPHCLPCRNTERTSTPFNCVYYIGSKAAEFLMKQAPFVNVIGVKS